MIDGLRPYAAYRASPDRWLTQFPSTWERVRIKYLLREIDRRTQTGEEPLLSMRRDHGLVPLSQFSDKVAEPKTLLAYKLVRPGELVVNRMQAGNGLVFVARIPGLISPDYAIFRPVRDVNLDYLELLFRSHPVRSKFRSESTGLGTGTAGFLRLYGDSLGAIEIGLPSAEEQAGIVRFLDHADRQIRRYVRDKKRLIALLSEQKQAIIHRDVTRGLDPDVRLKTSGVEWLGDVPEHWQVLPLKRWVSTKVTDGPHETPQLLDDGVPFMSAESMVQGRLEFSRRRGFISKEQHAIYCRKCRPRRDDIFMCKSGATTGKVAIVETDDEFSVWSPLALIRVDPKRVLARLLFWILQTRYVQQQVQDTWSYGTQPNLAMAAMERLMVALPGIEEQRGLLEHLGQIVENLSGATERTEREIALLREYRSRLIADVVMGKVDVRAAAAHLPSVPATFEEEGSLAEDAAESDNAELDDADAEVPA